MAGWISTIEAPYWTNPIRSDSWPEKYAHQEKLKGCTAAMLRDMGITHKRIVYQKETNKVAMENYVKQWTVVLGTLWLKRSATRSAFFGHTLTNVPLNTHHRVSCQLPPRFYGLSTPRLPPSQAK